MRRRSTKVCMDSRRRQSIQQLSIIAFALHLVHGRDGRRWSSSSRQTLQVVVKVIFITTCALDSGSRCVIESAILGGRQKRRLADILQYRSRDRSAKIRRGNEGLLFLRSSSCLKLCNDHVPMLRSKLTTEKLEYSLRKESISLRSGDASTPRMAYV